MPIDVPAKVKALKTARQLIENSYQDLKNVKEFREYGSAITFVMATSYQALLKELDFQIAGAEAAAAATRRP